MIKVALALPIALALTILAVPAHAQGVDELGGYGGKEKYGQPPIPQRFAIELRFGPYKPRVDESTSGSPYEQSFGDSNRYFFGLEADWQALRVRKVLSFGPGLAWAYTRSTGKARIASSGTRSSQDTSLSIMPLYLAGVLRIDAIADSTPVPLVPYAKLGLGYALWWSSDGDETARADGTVGKDASYGYMWAAGLMLRLDALDRDDANTARASSGLDHSYLFGEWHSSRLDGFGSASSMDVGTSTWVVGLALEAIL